MRETTLTFDTKTIKKLIENYYKEYFQDESIKTKYDVFEEDDYSCARVVVNIIRNIKKGEDYNLELKNTFSNEDIIKIINHDLLKYNEKVQDFNFDVNGTDWVGVSVLLENIDVKKKELRKE